MENTSACIRHSEVVSGSGMIECGHDETVPRASVSELGCSSDHALERCDGMERSEVVAGSGKVMSDVEERIERSKDHWSELTDPKSELMDEELAQENRQVFEKLQRNRSWGHFFLTFGYDTKVWQRAGELVVEEKFAEGGQAELFHAKVIWRDQKRNQKELEEGCEWVLKVFKKGTCLRDLQSKWPLGYFEWWAEYVIRRSRGLPPRILLTCDVYCGTLLQDGRFAFIMVKEHEDLRSRIDHVMLDIGNDKGPFSKDEVERIMFHIARGMHWLHRHNILHRDLKASNVLVCTKVGSSPTYYVADFECSVGVVGTGFFRAPEILQAVKNKVANNDSKVFSKASDVYSYGMTCYEVLTGKLPFEGHPRIDYDLVLSGHRPKIPEYIDSWVKELLCRCWDVDSSKRPLFREIVEILSSNSTVVRKVQLEHQKYEDDLYRRYKERAPNNIWF